MYQKIPEKVYLKKHHKLNQKMFQPIRHKVPMEVLIKQLFHRYNQLLLLQNNQQQCLMGSNLI
ncbi:MAG: hypothetical protein BHW06_08420 [Clostridium sp. 44_14]|nr:MAG: hypothetical protein BHW06_08420 [Clostridium sp. 44_14]